MINEAQAQTFDAMLFAIALCGVLILTRTSHRPVQPLDEVVAVIGL